VETIPRNKGVLGVKDQPISVTTVCALLLWVAGFGLGVYYAVEGVRGTGVLGVQIMCAGAVLTVRRYVIRLEACLREREEQAFELGLRIGREEGTPPPSPHRVK
jgi:hypothetical protein